MFRLAKLNSIDLEMQCKLKKNFDDKIFFKNEIKALIIISKQTLQTLSSLSSKFCQYLQDLQGYSA